MGSNINRHTTWLSLITAHRPFSTSSTPPTFWRGDGKFFRKWLGNHLTGNTGTVKKMTGSAGLEAEKAASAFLPTIGVVLLAWPTVQTKPEDFYMGGIISYDGNHS